MLIEVNDRAVVPARLKVIGIGGCGGNAVGRMIREGLEGLEFLVVNTDLQALEASPCPNRLQIGAAETRGLGTGGDPERGRKAAEEDAKILEDHIAGADMLFVTAGMGGGTGTGAAPVVARIARSLGILTVAIVTTPFSVEGRPRMRIAQEGIRALKENVDTLIVVPNEKLLEILDPATPLEEAYRAADEVLYQATRGISEIITRAGIMNRDFADVRSVMSRGGNALMGIGTASGEDRAREAARKAISNPLLEDVDIRGAQAVLVNVAGGQRLGFGEVYEAARLVQEAAGEDAHVFLGNAVDPNLGDEVRVTVIATGFGGDGTSPVREEAPREAEAVSRREAPQAGEDLPLWNPDLVAAEEERGDEAGLRDYAAASGPLPPAAASPDPRPSPELPGDGELPPTGLEEATEGPEEAEELQPLPLSPLEEERKRSWAGRLARRAFDVPAFRRRPAR
jgi:cell division protein FtsZ